MAGHLRRIFEIGEPEQPLHDQLGPVDEDTALGMAAFYNEGYEGRIPDYAEEQLAHARGITVEQLWVEEEAAAGEVVDDKKG